MRATATSIMRRLADEIAAYVPAPSAAVLDYGCGEALHADRLAVAAGALTLAEAAPAVRARLDDRFARQSQHHRDVGRAGAGDAGRNPSTWWSCIRSPNICRPTNSTASCGLFHRLLQARRTASFGDVVPPHVPAISDALALLRFGWSADFFLPRLPVWSAPFFRITGVCAAASA